MQIVMKQADTLFVEEQRKARLSTGIHDLDVLIDSIRLGQLHLFYSHDADVLDYLIHHILVSGSLLKERGGCNTRTLYFNTCNYHLGKTLLYPSRLARIAKQRSIDPKSAFQSIYAIAAFNEMQQVSAMKEVVDLMRRDFPVQLVVVHNVTRFIETSKKPRAAQRMLNQVVGLLKKTAVAYDVALVISCVASKPWQRRIPNPVGGAYLRHEAHVVVFLERGVLQVTPFTKVTLVKHPYKATPQSISLCSRAQDANLSGSVTSSFQQQVHEIVDNLRETRDFKSLLSTPGNYSAFECLVRAAWSRESMALSKTKFPNVIDAMNLIANVHNKHCVEALWRRVEAVKHVIEDRETMWRDTARTARSP